MNELKADFRTAELYERGVRPGSMNYNSNVSKLKKLCNKYGMYTYTSDLNSIACQLKSEINSRIRSMENAEYLEGQRNLVSIVKKAAEDDNDATYEELFTQMKIECLNRWYGQFETRFTSALEAKQKELESKKLEVVAKAEKLDNLLASWNDISDKQIEAMNRKIRDEIVDNVMGSGFSDEVEQEGKKKEALRLDIESKKRDREMTSELMERRMQFEVRALELRQKHELALELEKIRANQTRTNINVNVTRTE